MDVKDDRMRNRSVFIRSGELLEYVAFFSQEYLIQFQRFTIVVQAGLVRVVSPVGRIDDTDYAAVDSFKLESEEDEFQFIEAGSIFGAIFAILSILASTRKSFSLLRYTNVSDRVKLSFPSSLFRLNVMR